MTYVECAPGVELYVQDVGTGPAVALLHGWGLDHSVWDRQVRVLAEHGHRVVAVDLRGHGRSTAPLDGYRVEQLGDDVAALLARLDLADVVLAGWSLGGLTAFRVAAHHPERIRRLVLVASNGVANTRKPGFPFGVAAETQEDTLVEREKHDRFAFRREVVTAAFRVSPSPDLLEWLLRVTAQTPSWVAIACLRTLLHTDQVEDLQRLHTPVVQILGALDPALSRRAAKWLVERLPNARQTVLDGCGHYPMFEAPDAFDAALLDAAR